jgi:osmotically-inducible protein OsmY
MAVHGDSQVPHILSALRRRIHSDAGHIQVGVNGSEVTLSGTVHSGSERDTARNSAWATPGVRNVADNLSVVF